MYSMDLDKLPRRAIVPSQLSAEAEFKTWLRENCFELLKDKDGQQWHTSVEIEVEIQSPNAANAAHNPANPTQVVVRLALSAVVDAPTFVKTQVLKPDEDERLLALLEGESIPLRMKPREFRVKDETEAQRVLADELPRLREELRSTSLIEPKRALIGRWVNSRYTFSKRY